MSDSGPHRRSNLGRTNLGRGLAALLGEETEEPGKDAGPMRAGLHKLPTSQLHPGRGQPRRQFDDAALADLADSIRQQGVLQPILVRPHPARPGEYEIVAGERRWRAAQLAQLHEVPVVLRELNDGQALEIALVENVQRQDLNPIEEAEGYRRLIEEFGHSQEDLGRLIGKSRPHIANTLRLLGLPEEVKVLVSDGRLSAGHARALLGAPEPRTMAERVVRQGLSVRETEKLAARQKEAGGETKRRGGRRPKTAAGAKDPDTLALEADLSAMLGLKVTIEIDGEGGQLTIHYSSLEQLDDVLQRLSQGERGGGQPH